MSDGSLCLSVSNSTARYSSRKFWIAADADSNLVVILDHSIPGYLFKSDVDALSRRLDERLRRSSPSVARSSSMKIFNSLSVSFSIIACRHNSRQFLSSKVTVLTLPLPNFDLKAGSSLTA
jgi:hypothetical protein